MTTVPASPSAAPTATGRERSKTVRRFREWLIESGLVGCASFSILTTAAIIAVLTIETVRFFRLDEVSVWEFLTGLEWNPLLGAEKHFGIWPLICGTMLVTGVAMLVAIPLGLMTAVFLSEYAPRAMRSVLKPILEVLAGVPTVVYGFFALTIITPMLQKLSTEPGCGMITETTSPTSAEAVGNGDSRAAAPTAQASAFLM